MADFISSISLWYNPGYCEEKSPLSIAPASTLFNTQSFARPASAIQDPIPLPSWTPTPSSTGQTLTLWPWGCQLLTVCTFTPVHSWPAVRGGREGMGLLADSPLPPLGQSPLLTSALTNPRGTRGDTCAGQAGKPWLIRVYVLQKSV